MPPCYSYQNNIPTMSERIIAVLSYVTSGIVGIIWLLLATITKSNLKPFLKDHIMQSIFLMLLYYLAAHLLIFILNILAYVPFFNAIISTLNFFLNISLVNLGPFHMSIINIFIFLFIIYLSIGTLRGRYVYIPWVSNVIKGNIF